MTSDNIWDPSDINIPHHSLVIGSLKYDHPDKYNDNYEYDVLTCSIYSINTERLAEGLSDEAATVSEITKKEFHYKLDGKTLAQIWRIGLCHAQQALKTTTRVGIKYAVHPLTRRYKMDIIHGYNDRILNTTMYFYTLFTRFRSLNGDTCAQIFIDT